MINGVANQKIFSPYNGERSTVKRRHSRDELSTLVLAKALPITPLSTVMASSSSGFVSYTTNPDYTKMEGFKQFHSHYNMRNTHITRNDPNTPYPSATTYNQAKNSGLTERVFQELSFKAFVSTGCVAACHKLKHCHQTLFSSFFLSIFNPTSTLSLLTFLLIFTFLVFIPFLMLHSCSRQHDKDTIQLVLIHRSTTSDIGCQTATWSLDYWTPETVHLPVYHPILHWNSLGHPLSLPPIKVQDFLNTERE